MSKVAASSGLITVDMGLEVPPMPRTPETFYISPIKFFDVGERAKQVVSALGSLGFSGLGNEAVDRYKEQLQGLHDALVADQKPGDEPVLPYLEFDLDDECFTLDVLRAMYYGAKVSNPEDYIYRPLWGKPELVSSSLNKRLPGEQLVSPTGVAQGRFMGVLKGEGKFGLHFTVQDWASQQGQACGFIDDYPEGRHGQTGAFMTTPQGDLMKWAMLREELPESAVGILPFDGWHRYVQHDMLPVEKLGGSLCGPSADVYRGGGLPDFYLSNSGGGYSFGVGLSVGQVEALKV